MPTIFAKFFIGLFLLTIIALPALALAQSAKDVIGGIDVTAGEAGIEKNVGTPETISTRVGQIINYAFGLFGVIFLTVVIIGGYQWMVAGGNEDKVGKAKKMIFNGINGLIAIFLGYALVYVILAALGNAAG